MMAQKKAKKKKVEVWMSMAWQVKTRHILDFSNLVKHCTWSTRGVVQWVISDSLKTAWMEILF